MNDYSLGCGVYVQYYIYYDRQRRSYMHYASKCTRSTHRDARAYTYRSISSTVICVVVCESIELFTDVMIYDGQVWSLLVQRYLRRWRLGRADTWLGRCYTTHGCEVVSRRVGIGMPAPVWCENEQRWWVEVDIEQDVLPLVSIGLPSSP